LRVDTVIAMKTVCSFDGPPCIKKMKTTGGKIREEQNKNTTHIHTRGHIIFNGHLK